MYINVDENLSYLAFEILFVTKNNQYDMDTILVHNLCKITEYNLTKLRTKISIKNINIKYRTK